MTLKRRFPSKIANFSHPRVFNAPLNGFPLELGIGAWGQKLEWVYTMVEKVLKIGLAVLIKYRRVTGTQPATQLRCRSKDRAYVHVALVKKI